MRAKKDLKKHLYKFDEHDIVYAFKMLGNNNRMKILKLISERPGITLDKLSELLGIDFKNASFHARKLYQSKLIIKKTVNQYSHHYLNNYGKEAILSFNKFLKIEHE